MKRSIITLTLLILLAAATASSAAEFLLLTEVKKVRVLEIRDGKAVVQGQGGYTGSVEVGDTIGRERGRVVEIGRSYVMVETETARIKFPVGIRMER